MSRYFRYTCTLQEPLVKYHGCLSAEDLLANWLRQNMQADAGLTQEDREMTMLCVNLMYQEAVHKTCVMSHQYPNKVLFFSFPPADGTRCAICAITQVESGCCYLFTSDCDLAGMYIHQGCKVKMW